MRGTAGKSERTVSKSSGYSFRIAGFIGGDTCNRTWCFRRITTQLIAFRLCGSWRFLSAVEDSLSHPYLSSLHDLSDEPTCPVPFTFDLEHPNLSDDDVKEFIYLEACALNPA